MQEDLSPIRRILARRERRGKADPAVFVTTRQRELTATNWGELATQARNFGLGLCALGVHRGDVIGILAPTGPESVIVVLGALLVGACITDLGDGRDLELSVEILRRSGSRLVICGERDHAEVLAPPVRQQCGERGLIGWGAASSVNAVVPFGQVCLKGSELADREPNRATNAVGSVELEDLALLLPDSQRDGSLREVRLSHDNCIVSAESLRKSLGVGATDRIASFGQSRGLVEQVLVALLSALTGASIVHDVGELSPLVMAQTARVSVVITDGDTLDALQRDLERELLVGAAWRRRFSRWAHRVGNEVARRRISGTELGLFLGASHLFADSLVLAEQRRLLGGQLRRIVVHAAGLRRSTRWFFESIGISPLGFTGTAASAGIGLLELPDNPRPGSYGRGMPGVDVWVDAVGRIRIRGANVSRTAEGVDGRGWLDLDILGEIDDEGTIWPESALGALDAPSLAVLPIADEAEQPER